MYSTIYSLCLIIIRAARTTDAQTWPHDPKDMLEEPGFVNVDDSESTAPIIFDSRGFFFRTVTQSPPEIKQVQVHETHLEPWRPPSEQITVECNEYMLRVEVRKDFWGALAPRLTAAELSLGRACRSTEDHAESVVFSYASHTCGSERNVTDEELVYSNFLFYTPSDGALAQGRKIATVHCHYRRENIISSNGVKPTWSPKSKQKSIAGRLDFSFHLMSEDWQSKSKMNTYYLGQTIHLQVTVNLYNHHGLKVYVDSCVATANQQWDSEHIYPIIQAYGCLVDSKMPRSMARFLLPRSDGTLRFQLKAFQFQSHENDQIFIHCVVKVIDSTAPPCDQSKSCQYNADIRSWEELEGHNSLCECCEAWSCGRSRRGVRDASAPQHTQWNNSATFRNVMVGPIRILPSVSSDEPRGSKASWDILSQRVFGTGGVTLGQLVAACVVALSAVCILVGLFILCHALPAHKPPPTHPAADPSTEL